MNLMITADNIISIVDDIQSKINSIEGQLEKLTGPFACEAIPTGPEYSAVGGTLGATLGEAFKRLVLAENQLSNMLSHLRDNVLETSNTNLTAPASKCLEPETVEAVDLPRFLKKAIPTADDFTNAVARDLGVEHL